MMYSAKAQDILSTIGISANALLELEGLLPDRETTLVYLSGSLVEGFGNQRSDLDVFVVGAEQPAGKGILIEKSGFSISIHYLGDRRIDFEYWSESEVVDMASAIDGIDVGGSFVADKLEADTKLFVHRLKFAEPVSNPSKLADIKAIFDWKRFQGYLVQEAIHRIDGALEDVWGMLELGRYQEGALRARDLVGSAADAWRFFHGETNPLEKWRLASLSRIAATEPSQANVDKFLSLVLPAIDLKNPADIEAYVRSCVSFAEDIVRDIQG